MRLWQRSTRSNDDDWTPVAGNTPEEIGRNFAATVDSTGMSEADIIAAMLEDAESWSDDPSEQSEYLIGLKQGLGL